MHINQLRNRRGNSFIEYFILAGAVAIAAMMFFGGGNFSGIKGSVQSSFTSMMNQIAK